MTQQKTTRPGMRALQIGLALTVLAVALPLVDLVTTDIVGDHVRSAYPQWDGDTVATERTAIVGWLAGSSTLGLVGWGMTMLGLRRGKRWVRPVATTWFLLGIVVAGMNLSMGGAAYAVIVPSTLGLVSALPVIAGAVAVVQLWRAYPARGTQRASGHQLSGFTGR